MQGLDSELNFYTVNGSFTLLQIASIGLQTMLLIILTGTCAIAGNGVRFKKSWIIFLSFGVVLYNSIALPIALVVN